MEDSDWETLAQNRMTTHLCGLFKVYSGERAWKAIRDRLRRPYYMIRIDHIQNIRKRKQKTDIRKYSFVNMTIKGLHNTYTSDSNLLGCETVIE
jgi:hypothetical protein